MARLSGFGLFPAAVNNTNDAPVLANALAGRLATEGMAFSYALSGDTFHDDDAILTDGHGIDGDRLEGRESHRDARL